MQDLKQLQREAILASCAKNGIKVSQRGSAYLLSGHGVDLRTADLANLDENDLAPYQPRKESRP